MSKAEQTLEPKHAELVDRLATKTRQIAEAICTREKATPMYRALERARWTAIKEAGIGNEEYQRRLAQEVLSELGRRGREMRLPKPAAESQAASRESAKPPMQDPQLGFGFGEGPRHKIRPPTRRHL